MRREENFGDLMTADHEILIDGEGGGSNKTHRYAVSVQHFITQWIQSYSCNTKTSQETTRCLQKFLESKNESEGDLQRQFTRIVQSL